MKIIKYKKLIYNFMNHLKSFQELNEIVKIRGSVKKEKLPHCEDMEMKGYRIGYLNKSDMSRYAFNKDFEIDDDVYWLGYDNNDYKFGHKYIADQEIVTNKDNLPFYNLYCECDPSPNELRQEIIKKRQDDILKKRKDYEKKN